MQSDQKIVRFDPSFVNCFIKKDIQDSNQTPPNQFSSDSSDFDSNNDEPVQKEDISNQVLLNSYSNLQQKIHLRDRLQSEHAESKVSLQNDSFLSNSNQNTSHSGFLYDNLSCTQKTSGSSINKMDLNFDEKFNHQEENNKPYSKQTFQQQTPYQQIQKKRRFEPQKEINKFLIDLDKVYKGLDQRTTLMIRNIPNKYNQMALLKEFDENHYDTYDFFYLPIDFTVFTSFNNILPQNRCNVGYAFINFSEPRFIPQFYMKFHNKKWRMYNSEKICQLTYARIQGKDALLNHFQFSSIMNQKDKKVKPVFFQKNNLSCIEALVQKQKLYK